jgi:hypothetical protein
VANNLYFFQFGTRLSNNPAVSTVSTGNNLVNGRGLTIVEDQSGLSVLVCSQSTNLLTVLRYGSDINNVPDITSYPITGASSSYGIAMVRECNNWYGLISDNSGNGIVQIS